MKQSKTYFAVKDILPDVIANLSSGNIRDTIHIENVWKDIVGVEITGLVYAGFKDGCVLVMVDTSARLYQWKLKKAMILRRLNEKCPQVKNISLKIGKVK